jgi:hypothetical protein
MLLLKMVPLVLRVCCQLHRGAENGKGQTNQQSPPPHAPRFTKSKKQFSPPWALGVTEKRLRELDEIATQPAAVQQLMRGLQTLTVGDDESCMKLVEEMTDYFGINVLLILGDVLHYLRKYKGPHVSVDRIAYLTSCFTCIWWKVRYRDALQCR